MTKKQLKKWLPEITHWTNGGDLYVYDPIDDTWNVKTAQTFRIDQIYVIKDRHFEVRKAYALGEEIEYLHPESQLWQKIEGRVPLFDDWIEYRPKPKEPTYDYQFTFKRGDEWHMSTGRAQGLKEAMHFIVGEDIAKFKPSKRIRK